MAKAKKIDEFTWRDFPLGGVVTEPGSSTDYLTGGWATVRPIVHFEQCIRCGVCWTFCPEGCIHQNDEGYFVANLDYCKGCGICAVECYTGCIEMKE
jgi:pyruvate ferredoxin oxidoreductase delta subunit